MKSCRSEAELVSALRRGCWPLGADAELRQHVAQCRRCSETAAVAGALLAAAAEPADAPRAGTLWWRAQLDRQRRDAERASQPLRWAAGAGMGALIASMLALVPWTAPSALAWAREMGPGMGLALLGGTATLCATSLAAWLFARRDA